MKFSRKLLLVLLLLTLAAVAQAQFTFTTNADNTLTLTGYTDTNAAVTIPDSTNGYQVTSISRGAFPLGDSVTSVTIPNSITNIGIAAFANSFGLTNLTVVAGNPDYTTTNGVLFNEALTTVIQYPAGVKAGNYMIPGSVTNIGNDAFLGSRLTNVDIPNSVISIGASAFNVSRLTSVTVPNGVASIGEMAFLGCSSLANVTIGNGVTNIGVGAFSECFSLTNIAVDATNADYASVDGVLFDKTITTLIQYPSGLRAGNYAITNSVTIIGGSAFADSLMTAITIPNSVTNIGSDAFQNCSNLINIAVAADNPSYASVSGVLFNKAMTLLIQCPGGVTGSYAIPNSVTSIGRLAFELCSGLRIVTIPNSVTNIGDSAFALCGLREVYFQGNAPGAGSDSFMFFRNNTATIYYLPGTTGWHSPFDGRPVVLWNPQAATGNGSFGVQSNQFGFNITGSSNLVIVVEACTNLAGGIWSPVSTNTLNTIVGTNGTSYFSDPQWTNSPARLYRFRSP